MSLAFLPTLPLATSNTLRIVHHKSFACMSLPPLSSPSVSLGVALRNAPHAPGVYQFMSATHTPLYIGKATSLRARLRHYMHVDVHGLHVVPSSTLPPHLQLMVTEAVSLQLTLVSTPALALSLESTLIHACKPKYNTLLHPQLPRYLVLAGKSYPRLVLSDTPLHRNAAVFGPFPVADLNVAVQALRRVYPLRVRESPLFKHRTCSNFDVGACPGVCQRLMGEGEYAERVAQVKRVLMGNTSDLVKELRKQMKECARVLEYEQAAKLKIDIKAVQDTFQGRGRGMDADMWAACWDGNWGRVVCMMVREGLVVGRDTFAVETIANEHQQNAVERVVRTYYSGEGQLEMYNVILHQTGEIVRNLSANGEQGVGKKGTKQVMQVMNMVKRNAQWEVDMVRMEMQQREEERKDLEIMLGNWLQGRHVRVIMGIDVSHWGGQNAVGAAVMFREGARVIGEHRRYALKPSGKDGKGDDYAWVAETVQRRMQEGLQDVDLVVVDGGKGQVEAVSKMLNGEILVVGVAKREEQVFVEGVSEDVNDGRKKGEGGVRLLGRVRDEAHRVANKGRRARKMEWLRTRGLRGVEGLGKRRLEKIVKQFGGSEERVALASMQELMQVDGVGRKMAERIYSRFEQHREMMRSDVEKV